jgi:signal transduction histidine kinase
VIVQTSIGVKAMSHLAVVSTNAAFGHAQAARAAQAAHDLRNLLATVGLHVETLQRLSGPSGSKAADAAQALLIRGAAVCNGALDHSANVDGRARRRGIDLTAVVREVADLLGSAAPKGFSFKIDGTATVLADPDETFRILFNLMSNAVAVANRKGSSLKSVTIEISGEGSMVTIRIADDGPGLPAGVRACLFGTRARRQGAPHHGYGLAIARELAERNGGTLALVPSPKGTTFALSLPAFLSVLTQDGPRDLGRWSMAL